MRKSKLYPVGLDYREWNPEKEKGNKRENTNNLRIVLWGKKGKAITPTFLEREKRNLQSGGRFRQLRDSMP